MRTGTITKRLTISAIGLGLAVVLAAAPAGPAEALAAPAAVQNPAEVHEAKQIAGNHRDIDTGQDTEGENKDPVTGTAVKKTSVLQYINAIYVWVAFVGGLIAIISLIYAGYSYMASYGDPEKIANAKDIVEKTLIGLALLILAALILNTINPRTVSDPCKPGEPGCGDIDFTEPGG